MWQMFLCIFTFTILCKRGRKLSREKHDVDFTYWKQTGFGSSVIWSCQPCFSPHQLLVPLHRCWRRGSLTSQPSLCPAFAKQLLCFPHMCYVVLLYFVSLVHVKLLFSGEMLVCTVKPVNSNHQAWIRLFLLVFSQYSPCFGELGGFGGS